MPYRLRTISAVLILLLCSSTAWADEDDVPTDPRILLPGVKLFLALAAIGLAIIVWYQMRKRAMLRNRQKRDEHQRGGLPPTVPPAP